MCQILKIHSIYTVISEMKDAHIQDEIERQF